MSKKSATRGAAFEYITIINLRDNSNGSLTNYTENWCNEKGIKKFNSLGEEEKNEMRKASNALIGFLDDYESWVKEEFYIEKSSSSGGETDVTDVRIFNDNNSIGLSLKSNNDAVRHQRVSPTIDIINEWTGFSADTTYMNNIENIFNNFINRCEENNITEFNQMEDKFGTLYKPICEEVAAALDRIFSSENGEKAMQNFITYLIGSKDFYKVQAEFSDDELIINSYNFRNNINTGNKLGLPTKCFESIAQKSRQGNWNNVYVAFNNGWEIKMRIHNAKKEIENSLKFDTRLVGVPSEIWQTRRSF